MEVAIAKTQSLISASAPQPIFEVGFKADNVENGGALAFVDVLLPESNGLGTAWPRVLQARYAGDGAHMGAIKGA